MTQPKSSSSYPPEFFAFFEKASETSVTLELESSKEATTLRAKMYACRLALRRENHPLARVADNVEIVKRENLLVGRPAGLKFASAFERAGIKLESEDEPEKTPPKREPREPDGGSETDDLIRKTFGD